MRNLRTLLVSLSLAAAFSAGAYDFAVDGVYYNVSGTNASVTYASESYNSYSGEVTIPSTVTYGGVVYTVSSIGQDAFAYSTGLTSVTLGQNVETIGAYAFAYCTSLSSVTFGSQVSALYSGAFCGCTSLAEISLPNSLTYISTYAFRDCTALTQIVIPNSVTSIYSYAFYGCSSLESVTLSESLSYLMGYTFTGTAIKTITIPARVDSIGGAFHGCTALQTIDVPSTVNYLGEYAFQDCTSLTTVTTGDSVTVYNTGLFYNCENLTDISISSAVETIRSYAFYGCSSLVRITIPEGVSNIETYVFTGCTSLTRIYSLSATPADIDAATFRDYTYSGATLYVPIGSSSAYASATGWGEFASIVETDFSQLEDDVTYYLPGTHNGWSVTDCEYRFGETDSVTYTLKASSESLTTGTAFKVYTTGPQWLGYSGGTSCAFDTPYVLSVIDANNVSEAADNLSLAAAPSGEYVYLTLTVSGDTTYLTVSETDPGLVSEFELNGVYYTVTSQQGLTVEVAQQSSSYYTGEVVIPAYVTYKDKTYTVSGLGERAFSGCTGITSISLPATLKTIGLRAFASCTGLTEIDLPDSVNYIGEYAFLNNNITSITIPKMMETITAGAFKQSNITQCDIPNTVTAIGEGAFAMSPLAKIVIPNSVTTLGESAYYMCSSADTAIIGNSVTATGDYTFAWCTSLKTVIFGDSITDIGSRAFLQCKALTQIEIPSTVTTMEERAFWYCTNLDSIVIGSGVSTMEADVFTQCPSITAVTCLASTPPTYSGTFDDAVLESATLYVPYEAKATYAATTPWRYFTNIVEMEEVTYETTYWLSGGYNDWITSDNDAYGFTNNTDGTHTLSLDEFYGEFKIITEGGGAWYGYGTIDLDTEYTLSTSGGNISLPSASDTYTGVTFTLTDADDGSLTLKVSAQGQVSGDVTYYLVGDSPLEWSASDTYALAETGTDGVYALTISSDGLTTSTGMKVLTSTSLWLGYESYNIDYGTSYQLTTSGNNFYLNSAPSTDALTFTLTVADGAYYITVTDSGESGVSAAGSDSRQVASRKYYTASGAQVAEPADGQRSIYIVVTTYSDGSTSVTKQAR